MAIPDGDFESGDFGDWTYTVAFTGVATSRNTPRIDDEAYHSGLCCLKVLTDSTEPGDHVYCYIYSDWFDTTGYGTVGFYVACSFHQNDFATYNCETYANISVVDEETTETSAVKIEDITDNWEYKQIDISGLTGNASIKITVMGNQAME